MTSGSQRSGWFAVVHLSSSLESNALLPLCFAQAAVTYSQILHDRLHCRQGCDPQLNHAMLLVGYNRGSGPGKADAYWIVKNSWGTE
jgi:aminopeptidase C